MRHSVAYLRYRRKQPTGASGALVMYKRVAADASKSSAAVVCFRSRQEQRIARIADWWIADWSL
eukprot:8727221-Alexandrium_andersonii.AAC.1